jgi:hypothetical protein
MIYHKILRYPYCMTGTSSQRRCDDIFLSDACESQALTACCTDHVNVQYVLIKKKSRCPVKFYGTVSDFFKMYMSTYLKRCTYSTYCTFDHVSAVTACDSHASHTKRYLHHSSHNLLRRLSYQDEARSHCPRPRLRRIRHRLCS